MICSILIYIKIKNKILNYQKKFYQLNKNLFRNLCKK